MHFAPHFYLSTFFLSLPFHSSLPLTSPLLENRDEFIKGKLVLKEIFKIQKFFFLIQIIRFFLITIFCFNFFSGFNFIIYFRYIFADVNFFGTFA